MKPTPSFERINYLLRPNKHVERKTVFDILQRFAPQVSFRDHRYVGFGSIWFVDFILAHRILKLRDMLSIEYEQPARADFNKPYATIEVRPGLSTDVFIAMAEDEWRRPQLVWLDYDGLLDDTVADDLELLTRKLPRDSVLLVTINSARRNYRRITAGGGSSTTTAFDAVGTRLGEDARPANYELTADAYPDISEDNFSPFLAEAILNFVRRKMRTSGRQEGPDAVTFVPAFNFCHVDGVEMVTVGGFFTAPDREKSFECFLGEIGVATNENSNPTQTLLDLIQLTAKEKISLDRLLPYAGDDFGMRAEDEGLRLPPEQYAKYREHYWYFPLFAEALF